MDESTRISAQIEAFDAARLAAQLARESAGASRSIAEIAADAVALVEAALYISSQRASPRIVRSARRLADSYGAEFLDSPHPCLRLHSGAYSGPRRNEFRILTA